MIIDAAKRVASLAGKRMDLPLGKPSFRPAELYAPIDFNLNNFKRIGPADPGKIAFLDGGNLPLIKTPSFAVHFERVYFNCFEGSERAKTSIPNRIEFFVVVTSSGENGEIKYSTEFVPLNKENTKFMPDTNDLVFDSYDETMRKGSEQMQIPRVGDVARSFVEWKFASAVVDELRDGDIFVRDGTLHAPYTNESKYAEDAYAKARSRGVLFCGVSKTSHLYTTSGLPLVAAISRLATESRAKPPWYYEKIVEISDPAHKADLNFAKLNANSEYVFRVEILKGQKDSKEKIMAALAANSRDISFPGYPYGLIDADKNARVSYGELDALRLLLFSEISKNKKFGDFKDFLAGSEAHDFLNRIV